MSERLPSLDQLSQRISAAKPPEPTADDAQEAAGRQGLSQALRLGVDLVAGVLVGAGLGYAIDQVAGTSPWFLIVCFFLGTAAGFRNMLKSVERLDKQIDNATDSGTTPRA